MWLPWKWNIRNGRKHDDEVHLALHSTENCMQWSTQLNGSHRKRTIFVKRSLRHDSSQQTVRIECRPNVDNAQELGGSGCVSEVAPDFLDAIAPRSRFQVLAFYFLLLFSVHRKFFARIDAMTSGNMWWPFCFFCTESHIFVDIFCRFCRYNFHTFLDGKHGRPPVITQNTIFFY